MENVKRNTSRIYFTEEQIKDIIYQYTVNLQSTVKIGKKYNCGNKAIARILEQNGIPRTGVGRRKYFFNEHYFDEINSHNKAYILGFLFADGSNCPTKQTISISLQEEDSYILEFMRKEFNQEKLLEFIDYSNKHDYGYTYKNQYRLLLFSKYLCGQLSSYRMVKSKSYGMDFPTIITDEFLNSFVLGYFDGNGTINITKNTTDCAKLKVSLISTFSFCNALKDICINKLGIDCAKVYEARNHNGITAQFSINSHDESMIFLDWLYKDSTNYLIRKYEKYNFCKMQKIA